MKKLLLLVVLFVLSVGVSYAYLSNQFKTNTLEIGIGSSDVDNATLIDLQEGFVLIPQNATVTQSNETKLLEYHLIVTNDTQLQYTITHNLPSDFNLTHNNSNAYFTTGTTYTISITLLNDIEAASQQFYINIVLV